MRDAETPPAIAGQRRVPPSRPQGETSRLGDTIYERKIRRQVEADHDGAVVAIDLESEKWAIGASVMEATNRLRALHPQAYDVWCRGVGYRAVYHFGGRPLPSAE